MKTQDEGYRSEDKWTFITEALQKSLPVSPIMAIPNIVCKDRNEEGGMGIHFFKNALAGGDWIIQEVLHNSAFLQTMLPATAPLSTIRIVTGSSSSFAGPSEATPIKTFSCVFRAGRAGAATDHDAILFDVDLTTGVIQEGSINREWYQLGLKNVSLANLRGPRAATRPNAKTAAAANPGTCTTGTGTGTGTSSTTNEEDAGGCRFTTHPDCGKQVTGITIPDIAKLKAICVDAHSKSCANVPLCGWDVALTTEGVVLLEVNLSCNFFQATVDHDSYFDFVDAHFKHLSQMCIPSAPSAEK